MSSALADHGGRFTADDWEQLDHDASGPRIELIGGEFRLTPAPAYNHQAISDELLCVLRDALRAAGRRDLRVISAVGVRLSPPHVYIPDLAVVRKQRPGTTTLTAADLLLAVEIVSPRSRRTDRMEKPPAYADAGVPHYWLVEPSNSRPPVVVCFELERGRYVERARVTAEESPTTVKGPVPVELDVRDLVDGLYRD